MSLCAGSFYWDFGDGTSSTDSLPVHQYADTGYYQATLVACNGSFCDTVKKSIYVDIVAYPDISWTVYQSFDTLFYKLNNPIPYELINWYFSDGGTSTSPDSFYVFQDTGYYQIHLLLRNLCGINFHDTSMYFTPSLASISNHSQTLPVITIYPNPANSVLSIESHTAVIEKIILFDMLGNIILTVENDNPQRKNNILITNLTSGPYFVKIISTRGVLNKKILKE